MREQHEASLAELTTLGLGGPAAHLLDAESESEIEEVVSDLSGQPFFVLGGGSNVVVDDVGWPGTVLRPAIRGIEVECEDDTVLLRVGAGEVWDELVESAVDQGWVGLACLSGIPGWVGAAPLQNIGAYGHEVGEVLTGVRAFDRASHAYTHFSRAECAFGYRSSVFRNNDRYVVTQVELMLRRTGNEVVRYPELARTLGVCSGTGAPAHQVRATVMALRRTKGMVVDPEDPESRSAGSFFVNPVVDDRKMAEVEARALAEGVVDNGSSIPRYPSAEGWKIPAAWLIERAGFAKGTTVDGVGISSKHALALVNRGGNTAALLALEQRIRKGVRETFGVTLAREPILVSPSPPPGGPT